MKAHNRLPSRQSLEPGSPKAILFFMAFALLLHVPLYFVPDSWLFSPKPPEERKRRVVYISRIPQVGPRRYQKQKQRLRNRLPRTYVERKQEKKKTPKPEKIRGQFVDVAPTPDDRVPEKSRFLSEYNTRVKKETISRHRQLKYKIAMPKLTKRSVSTPQRSKRQQRRVAMKLPQRLRINDRPKKAIKQPDRIKPPALALPRVRKQQKTAAPKSTTGTVRSQATRPEIQSKGRRLSLNLGPPLKIDPSLQPIPDVPERDPGKGTHAPSDLSAIDLRPNFGTLSRIEGAPAPDHVKGVEEGDATYLNSRQHIYATFFNRVKQQVAQHWSPNTIYRRRDPYGNVYGVRDRYTAVSVTLTPDGKLHNIKVYRSSGLVFLDREAMRAFREAQPFPNPPQGMVGKDGKIEFKFGFFLQISSPPRMLFFR